MPIPPAKPPPAPRSLAPMPPSEFGSREELLAGAKDWAAQQGFAVVIARSRFNRLWLKCDRGGSYENRRNLTPDQRKRKRGESRLLGCPFRMLATVKKDGIWKAETDNSVHNHGPSEDLSMHPTLRRMSEEQLSKVHEMCDQGKTPADTIDELRAIWPEIKVLTRDVYNARKKYKTQKELADASAGLPQERPYEDPNGIFPGPDEHGRWAWVPDGEEVTNKKSRRRRRTAPAMQTSLDPQLQTPNTPHTLNGQDFLNDYHISLGQSTYSSEPQFPSHASAPRRLQLQTSMNGPGEDSSYFPTGDHYGHSPHTSPSRLRSQAPQRRPGPPSTAVMSSLPAQPESSAGTPAAGGPKLQSGQVLMSRIERMEKEQRDQKNMLAQILGAVRGVAVHDV